jgi:hypothetical protein
MTEASNMAAYLNWPLCVAGVSEATFVDCDTARVSKSFVLCVVLKFCGS